MGHRKLISENILSENENRMIKEVMNMYGIEIEEVFRVRSAYKIVTSQGNLCLKRLSHGKSKASNGNQLVEHLFENGFHNTAKFLKTTHGDLFVKYRKYTLYVTEWIDGEECNLESPEEAANCIELLAQFHIAVNNLNTSKLKIKNNLKNWPKIFYNTVLELEGYKTIIERKKIKNEFDTVYAKYIDIFCDRGIRALNILNNSTYYKMSQIASKNKTLCHDSFYYQNILKKDNKYYLIDLDSIIIDLQVMDLGKFIRRLMFKKSYQWDFQKAKPIIKAYHNIKPLTYEELEVMIALITFPHKFWKLGKKRFIKQKNWSEQKYMHKLEKIIKYSDLQNNFFDSFIEYINSNKFRHN